jgi:hypothetical protein
MDASLSTEMASYARHHTGSYFALTRSGRMTAASTPLFCEARINSAFEITNTWITHDI